MYGGTNGFGPNGERGQPLLWRRDISSIEIDLSDFLLDQEGVEEAKLQWELLKQGVGEMALLPSGLQLTGPDRSPGNKVELEVAVSPGYFPGVVTTRNVRLQVADQATERPADVPEWSCSIPGIWDRRGDGQGSEIEAGCPDLDIDLGLSEDAIVDVAVSFDIVLAAGLEEDLRAGVIYEGAFLSWAPPEDEWADFWGSIPKVTSETAGVTVEVDLPTTGDKLRKFLPILIALIVLALLLRVFAAWRLRPWSPLVSPEYMAWALDVDQGSYSVSDASVERELCMALTRRSASGQMGGLRLFSMWKPLLFGGPPQLAAKSPDGRCVGVQGSVATRRGERLGLIGNSLGDGWLVEMSPTASRLIAWDLPPGDSEARARLNEVESAAVYRIEQMQEASTEADNADAIDTPEAMPPDSPTDSGSDPFAVGDSRQGVDPFSSEGSISEEDSRYIDPFDQ